MFATVPPLISTVELIYSRRWDLLYFLRSLPKLCLAEGRYLLTRVKLDPPAENGCLPIAHPTLPLPEFMSVTISQVSLSLTELLTYSPLGLLPEGSQRPEEVTAGPRNSPGLPGPGQHQEDPLRLSDAKRRHGKVTRSMTV